MQKCSYCGRENENGAQACRECGTELAQKEDFSPSYANTQKPHLVTSKEVEDAFIVHDAFSRPFWPAIFKALRHYQTPEERLAAWADVMSQ